jgi:conjugative transfer signal peptidase TraF
MRSCCSYADSDPIARGGQITALIRSCGSARSQIPCTRRGKRLNVRCLRGLTIGLLVGVAGVGTHWLACASGLWVNVTQSLPIGVYRITGGPIRRRSYVLACAPAWAAALAYERGYIWRGPCPGGTAYLGKLVAAIAGDTVELDEGGLTVNRRPLPRSAPLLRDARGRVLPQLRGRWIVPPGFAWLWAGWNARSFDSRYFGAVPLTGVRAVVRPLAQPRCR